MPRRRASSGKLVSKPLLLFKSAIESQPNLCGPRLSSTVSSSPPSSMASLGSSLDRPTYAPTMTMGAEGCEVLAGYDPDDEVMEDEVRLGTVSALQEAKGDTPPRCPFDEITEQLSDQFLRPRGPRPRLAAPAPHDSFSRRLSAISTDSKRRTLRLVRSTPSFAPPPQPVISHPMPLGSSRRIRKMPSIHCDAPPKSRLPSLPRMFAWRL